MKHMSLRIIVILFALIGLFGVVSFVPTLTQPVYAQGPDDGGDAGGTDGGSDGGGGGGGSSVDQAKQGITDAGGTSSITLEQIVRNVVNILSWIVGVVAVIMIIVAGLKYITSGGDAGGLQSAKNTLIYAIIGLIIAIFAQIIINFVIKKATNGGDGGDSGGDTSLIWTMLFS